MNVPVIDYASLDSGELQALEAAHAGLTTLGKVLDWGRGRTPPLAVEEIVTQDEYTHDVIVPLDAGRWLVYDTT